MSLVVMRINYCTLYSGLINYCTLYSGLINYCTLYSGLINYCTLYSGLILLMVLLSLWLSHNELCYLILLWAGLYCTGLTIPYQM